jgi:D-amino-acid dehydrogenase
MKIAIIGGGIIGLCSAYYLRKSGYDVTIIEKKTIGDACSLGNAGYISPSHMIPLAAPGMVTAGLKWMLNSESPFYIKPKIDFKLFSWMWKFFKASNRQRMLAAVPILKDMAVKSHSLYHEICRDEKIDFELTDTGLLMVYNSESGRHHELEAMEIANKNGVKAIEVNLNEYEPDMQINALGGIYYPGDSIIEPKQFTDKLTELLRELGVEIIENSGVENFNIKNGRIESVFVEGLELEADLFLVAAGSWSEQLLNKASIDLPLQAGKGYSFTIENPKLKPKKPMILVEGRVAVTPFQNKLRFAGTMEINGLNEEISQNRINGIKKTIQNYYPEYDLTEIEKVDKWYGFRPCTPDGMPYIGKINTLENLYVNYGHAMLGITLAPISGKLIEQIISKKELDLDDRLIDPNRYL